MTMNSFTRDGQVTHKCQNSYLIFGLQRVISFSGSGLLGKCGLYRRRKARARRRRGYFDRMIGSEEQACEDFLEPREAGHCRMLKTKS
jgi:hypothetical protein